MTKHFIASGCSFTEYEGWPFTIPNHFSDVELHNTGLRSQGNGQIARKAQYKIFELLDKGVSAEDIYAGIMWSGPTRMEFYFEKMWEAPNTDNWCPNTGNPSHFIPDAEGSWFITNQHWKHPIAKDWHESRFFNPTATYIRTYEMILATQNFLKSLGIDYFMTPFTRGVVEESHDDDLNLSWMRKLIDWDKWLPSDGCFEWVYLNTKLPWGLEIPNSIDDPCHPTTKQYAEFCEQVVVPHLKQSSWAQDN